VGYVFDPDVLHAVARGALATRDSGAAEAGLADSADAGRDLSFDEKVERIRAELAARYPGHIRPRVEWIFNIAGGAMGQLCVLHASITEYVIIFGTPIGTEGYSGRFSADDYFIILDGEQWAYAEGEHVRQVYRPGEMHHMPRGQARGYRIPDRCYALEYARGFIPQMLPFGLADSFSSTLDPVPVMRTMRVYTQAVVGELLRGKI
jgi:C-8 sterol isomerase